MQKEAWAEFRNETDSEVALALEKLSALKEISSFSEALAMEIQKLESDKEPFRRNIVSTIKKVLRVTVSETSEERESLKTWLENYLNETQKKYSDKLYSSSNKSVQNIPEVPAEFSSEPESVDGRLILRDNFEKLFQKYPEILTFGEDTGKIGGVNQAMEGMQEKFGKLRVSDTGIREATIIGQGIGMAMRGLRPLAEIQYLDYLYYALQIMRDDLATVHYRTRGGQKAPLIIRTRGHRLEGIWHAGSPMGAIINSVRGINVCVPRNMTQAAGMYNTLFQADEPALVVECLNGYRIKENKPSNIGEYTIPLGKVETVKLGTDITILSYGSSFNICLAAIPELEKLGISAELIDIRTLIPFDINSEITKSVKKTNRLIIIDEDVPGGASAYILNEVLNTQGAWQYLDSQPKTVSAQPHLPPYGTDGDYFSKPSIESVIDQVYSMMNEVNPVSFPEIY